MTSASFRWLSGAACVVVLSGCGSRSALFDAGNSDSGGGGGASPTGGSGGVPTTTSSGTTSTTETLTTMTLDACPTLFVEPTFVLSPLDGSISQVRTALLPDNDVVLSSLASSDDSMGQLMGGRLSAFGAWPPTFSGPTLIDVAVTEYEVGPGPEGPVALVAHNAPAVLVKPFYPESAWLGATVGEADHILFVTAIADRYFYAEESFAPDYRVLDAGSYQPGSLAQSEKPLTCTKTPQHGAAINLDQAFLAAFTAPSTGSLCDPDVKGEAGTALVVRYDSPPENGSFLQMTEGVHYTPIKGEALVHLALAPAPFGAWLVYQTDGATAELPPSIQALRLDPEGQRIDPDDFFHVSAGGFIPPEIAAVALGDKLAVAWVDTIDPSAPTIIVQLVRADGSLSGAASIPTNAAWYSGSLRLLASPNADQILVSWAGPKEQGIAAVARLDCAQDL